MAKNKFYVVWKGLNPGIYDNWAECKAQVDGQEGAKYKSFENREEAAKAFEAGYTHYLKTASSPKAVIPGIWSTEAFIPLPGKRSSISAR